MSAGLAEAVEAYSRGDAAAKDALLANLRGITALYPNHIWKEDYLLFPMTTLSALTAGTSAG